MGAGGSMPSTSKLREEVQAEEATRVDQLQKQLQAQSQKIASQDQVNAALMARMEKLPLATRVDQLQEQLQAQSQKISSQDQVNAALMGRVEKLEALVASGKAGTGGTTPAATTSQDQVDAALTARVEKLEALIASGKVGTGGATPAATALPKVEEWQCPERGLQKVDSAARWTTDEMRSNLKGIQSSLPDGQVLAVHFTSEASAALILSDGSHGLRASTEGQLNGGASVCKKLPHDMGWSKFGRGAWRDGVGAALWGEKKQDVLLAGPGGAPGKDADKLDVMLLVRIDKVQYDNESRTVPGRPAALILPRDESALMWADGHFWLPKERIVKVYRLVDNKQFDISCNERSNALAFSLQMSPAEVRAATRIAPRNAFSRSDWANLSFLIENDLPGLVLEYRPREPLIKPRYGYRPPPPEYCLDLSNAGRMSHDVLTELGKAVAARRLYTCIGNGPGLDISKNSPGGASLAALIKAACNDPNGPICKLDASNQGLGCNDFDHIGKALRQCNQGGSLTSIDLSQNNEGDKGLRFLGHSLLACETSKVKSLKCTHLDLKADTTSIRKDHPNNGGPYCANGPGAAVLLAAAMAKFMGSLTSLDLSGTDMGSEGAIALAPAIASSSSLTKVDLSFNKLDSTGVQALAPAIASSSSLTQVDIGGNKVDDEAAKVLAPAIASSSSLTSIHLLGGYSSPLTDEGKAVLKEAVHGKEGFTLRI